MRHLSVLFLCMVCGGLLIGALLVYVWFPPAVLAALPFLDDSPPGWAVPLVVLGVVAIAAIIFLLSRGKRE